MNQLVEIISGPVADGFFEAMMRLAIPILLAAIGGMFNERAGVLNIGLEGMMLAGAFVGFTVAYLSGSIWLGALCGAGAGAALGGGLSFYAVVLGANQVVVGIALNLLMVGTTSFAYRAVFGMGTAAPRIDSFQVIRVPILSDIPILGPLVFRQTPLVYLALILVPLAWVIVRRMAIGARITAVGEHPEAAETLGISVARVRAVWTIVSGGFAGLGGAFLSLSATGIFLDNMTAGRGYIALAILMLGRRQPWGIFLAALLFGGADALQLRGQSMGIGIPYQFLVMLPYLLTVIVLVALAGRNRDPAALGVPFHRARAE